MSDVPQGSGWWQASDGKWYAPELHPDYQAPTQAVPEAPSAGAGAGDPTQVTPAAADPEPTVVSGVPPVEPTQAVVPPTAAAVPPVVPPVGPPGAPPGPPPPGSNRGKVIAALVVLAAVIAAVLLFLANRNDDKTVTAQSSDSASATSDSSSSAERTTTTRRATTTTTSTTTTTVPVLTESRARNALLAASEVGPGFTDQDLSPALRTQSICGGASADQSVPPSVLVGHRSIDTTNGYAVIEELRGYGSLNAAKQAFQLEKQGATCAETSVFGETFTNTGPTDDTAKSGGADEAITFVLSGAPGTSQHVFARIGTSIVRFQFDVPSGTDATQAPKPDVVVPKGVKKVKNA